MSLVPSTETATKVIKALILSEQVLDDDQRDLNGCLAGVFRKMPLSSVVGVLAARLEVEIVQSPVLQLLAIVLDTDLATERVRVRFGVIIII